MPPDLFQLVHAVPWGLGTAVGWGVGDFLIPAVSRAAGRYRSLFYSKSLGIVLLFVVLPSLQLTGAASIERLTVLSLGWVALLSVLSVWAAIYTWRGFEQGRMSLVAPIIAANSAVTLALSWLLSGDRFGIIQSAGLVGTIAGVLLSSASFNERRLAIGAGERDAILASLVWGVYFWSQQFVVMDLGPYWATQAINVGSWCAMLLLALPAAARLRRRLIAKEEAATLRLPPRALFARILGMAICYSFAFLSFNLGVMSASPGLIAVIASLATPITVLLSFGLLGERLAKAQTAGVVLAVSSLFLVAFPA